MKHLPVPPLRQTLDRYLDAVRPLSDAEQQHRAVAVVEEFGATDGPHCQAELMRFAHLEYAAERSWLSEAWLSNYLTNREPLPLSSSVGFRIRWDSASTGVARAAEVVHRVSEMHLAYLRGEIDDEVNARGDTMDMQQWRVLAGGARRPRPERDVILDGSLDPAAREIGVLWKGHLVMVPISDEAGHPLPRSVLARALHEVSHLDLPAGGTFTHPSYLGGDEGSAYLDALLENPDNAAVYDRLVQALFVVNLTDVPASEEEHQERVTFHPGQAWTHKPFTYQVSLADDYVGVHVEHSVVDGVTLKSMIAVMQEMGGPEADGPDVRIEPLAWSFPSDLSQQLSRDIAFYEQRADSHRVEILQFPVAVPADMPFRVSHDAIQQFSLLYAQLAAYGRLRSTYEAVDMREYQSGRTECLRPNTADALALAQALLADEATPDHLYAALKAHKDQVVACKSGQGFNRHLLGLRLMADDLGLTPALFDHDSFDRLMTDFLSTTSVGDAAQIVRFTFAPTSVGGIGVNYCATAGMYEFCLTHDADETERIDDFAQALEAGVAAVGRLLVRTRDS